MGLRSPSLLLRVSVYSACAAVIAGTLRAQIAPDVTALDEMVVSGRAADLVGTATTASQGNVGYHELNTRPFLRRGELLEVIPGVVITQHSGGGKANQYFLRGFNLDHGTDFSVSVDGMPINLRTHAHGQGYADLNFLIPELIREINYSKGPFFAEVGDFSGAGAAEFELFDELPAGIISTTIGENNYGRVVVANSLRQHDAVTTFGIEATYDDGAWDLPEHFRRLNGMLRYHWTSGENEYAVTALAYKASWRSSDQIPLRAVAEGVVDRLGALDPSDQGETQRASLSFNEDAKTENGKTHLTAYAIYYHLNLYSNFTYFLDDPIYGDQFNQEDQRTVVGGEWERTWSTFWMGKQSDTKAGVQVRDDIIGTIALRKTQNRELRSTVLDDQVNEASAGLFGQNELRWTDWFRSTVGARVDSYRFHVKSDQALNSGTRSASIASPKRRARARPLEQDRAVF